MNNFFCEKCNKSFSSYKSLWNHNYKFHNENNEFLNEDKNKIKYNCRSCNKMFSNYQNRWKHEKICKFDKTFETQINELKKEIETLKSKPNIVKNINNINNINNGTINKGPVYNYLTPIGKEDLNLLTDDEIDFIMAQQMNAIIYMIQSVNFNKDLPKHHTYCTTDLNNKYISTINPETLEIEKQRKKDFYDNLLWNGINSMKKLYEKIKNKKTKQAIEYKKNIDNLVDFIAMNEKGKKTFVELINALSFNNRHMIQNTWLALKNNQLPECRQIESNNETTKGISLPNQTSLRSNNETKNDEHLTSTNDQLNESNEINQSIDGKPKKRKELLQLVESDVESDEVNQYNVQPKRKEQLPLFDSDYETESIVSDSDSDYESNEQITINYKNKSYILDDNKLFQINLDGNKGKLFGTYINGKVTRVKN
jgi:hypothetical protein